MLTHLHLFFHHSPNIAPTFWMQAIDLDPRDATLFSNRSLCSLCQGDGQKALVDALECRELRPDWPKACYRHGAALLSLKVGPKDPVGYTLLTNADCFLL